MICKNYILIATRVLVFLTIINSAYSNSIDSLRTEQVDGKLFIIHQVDQGETLYAISRRYKVSIPNIITYNPSAELDLKVGILIKIPLNNQTSKIDTIGMVSHEVKPKETLFSIAQQYEATINDIKSWNNLTNNELSIGQKLYIKSSSDLVLRPLTIDTARYSTHELQPGETFYSLSKKYEVSINQLKTWNNLEDGNALGIGQVLIVGVKVVKDQAQIETQKAENLLTEIDSNSVSTVDVGTLTDTTQTSKRVANVNGFEEIIETGIGELIPGSTETRKYLGFHRTAKIGTIMKVRHEMNNKMVFVRIIGRIPNTGDNKKVLLKISKAAYDRLGVIDPRFRIEVSYMP